MDWLKLLKSLQADFLARLQGNCLLNCQSLGQHREITVISGKRLERIQAQCRQIAEKHENFSLAQAVFIDGLKRGLAREVIQECFGDAIAVVPPYRQVNNLEGVEFVLHNSEIGVCVKVARGQPENARWSIGKRELERHCLVICLWLQEEIVSAVQPEYSLVIAGFLPTSLLEFSDDSIEFGMESLLYSGGIRPYLEQEKAGASQTLTLSLPKANQSVMSGLESSLAEQCRAYAYLSLSLDRYREEDYHRAIDEINEAIRLHPDNPKTYHIRGNNHHRLEEYQGAIDDYNQALCLVSKEIAKFYNNRGVARFSLGDKAGAIADYTEALRLHPYYANAHNNRGIARAILGDREQAVADYRQAASLYRQQGREENYQRVLEKIEILQVQAIERLMVLDDEPSGGEAVFTANLE